METSEIPDDSSAKDSKKRISIRRRLWKIAVFVTIQAVICFVLLEIVGRVFDPLGISYYPETARLLDTMIHEEPIGYRHQPNLQGRFHGVTYTINSIGLRDREIPEEKDPNEFRILMLGDSRVFGYGVEDDETVPRVVERMANEHVEAGRKVRVINMGVPSYNTEQELVQLETLGFSLQPDAVILLFSPNDLQTKMWVFEKSRSSILIDISQRSYAVCLLFSLRNRLAELADKPVNMLPSGKYDKENERWQACDRSLSEINRLCRERDIQFLLFVRGEADKLPYSLHFDVAKRENFAIFTVDPWTDPRWQDADRSAIRIRPRIDIGTNLDV